MKQIMICAIVLTLLSGCSGGSQTSVSASSTSNATNSSSSTTNSPSTPPPPSPTLTLCEMKIPPEQPSSVRKEATIYPTPPAGYGAVIGWVNATVGNGGTTGKVTVNNLQLWENHNGIRTLLTEKITCPACSDPNDQVWGISLEKSLWQTSSAWAKPNEGTKFVVSEATVLVPVANLPSHVYHLWNTTWPRPATKSGAKYYLQADVMVEGDGIVQIGIDYWQATNGGGNLEAAVSNWYCATPGIQTIKAGAYQ